MDSSTGRVTSATAAAIAVALVFGICLGSAPVSAQNARWGAGYFPNVPLTTHEGKEIHFYDDLIKGKVVAIDLIYTTCQFACPLETARLVQVQRVLGDRVGRDIFFYSITIDPAHDTPAVLADYAKKYRVGPGWQFLTGKASDIELISRKLGLYSEPDPANPDGHTPMLLVGNEATGEWMRNSALDNPKFLARTISDWLTGWENNANQALRSFAEVPAFTYDHGEYTFRNHCVACHTIGNGDAIGPDLKGVTARRDRRWLARFIATPDRVFADDDPIAAALLESYKQVRMPNLSLSDADVAALIDYITRQSGGTSPAGVAAPMRSMAGMPDVPHRNGSEPAEPATSPTVDAKPMLDAYLRLQQAFASDRIDGLMDNALTIATTATQIGSQAAAIKVAVNPFAQADDLAAARQAFGPLSDAIIAYLRATQAEFGADVNVAYCPMLRKHWMQKGSAVRNPYYGARMIDCGEIVRVPEGR